MSKIIFWIVVVFAALFVLRMLSLAKAKSRRETSREPPKPLSPPEPTVRCAQCGVFLPRTEATPIATGYRCNDPACTRQR
jgi:hypothetical protein